MNTSRFSINVTTLDVRAGEAPPPFVAYAFGRNGRLLTQAEVRDGRAELTLPELKEPEPIRIAVGPLIGQKKRGEVAAELLRLNAAEYSIKPDFADKAINITVSRAQWLCWLRFCTVRGTLVKRTTTGGLEVELPACGAEIEIYEVDPMPIIIQKIPPYILDHIRELVRKPWPPPPPEQILGGVRFPPIGPGPGPDPGPLLGTLIRQPAIQAPVRSIGAAAIRQEVMSIMAENRGAETAAAPGKQAEQPRVQLFAFPSGESTEIDPAAAMASIQALTEVPEIKSAAAVSLSAFVSSLVARPALLRPILCWIWPWGVSMQLVATATTDNCGKFSAVFFTGCSTDTPDLYFKAYRRIGFLRFPIYAPLPVACHTWWNYVCGTAVKLVTTSPFAHSCPPCVPVIAPDHWVLAMAVGNISLAAVRGTSVALQPTTDASNIGLTSIETPLGGSSDAPFAGYIRFRFEFDNTLRPDLNVRYYRFRWRKIGSGNPFIDSTEVVWRHYAHVVGTTLMIEPYKLGPQPVGTTPNLYEIPPGMPPVGQWIIADAVVDTTSAAFPSTTLAPAKGGQGDYEFELTLFDAAGNAVNGTTLGISYVVPTTLDLTTTIPTADASGLGLVSSGRLLYQLHIDNNPTGASVLPPMIGAAASADPCGLLRYEPTDSVTFKWTAMQPYGFATYRHNLVKGATVLPAPISSSGSVGPAPGTHTENQTVASLLGSCTIAGFAETVSVWATATDGWRRLEEYDCYTIQAFALAPTGA